MHVKVSGVWKEVTAPSVNVGGVWKNVTEGWVRVSGVWKKFFEIVTANCPEELIAFFTTAAPEGTTLADGNNDTPNCVGVILRGGTSQGTQTGSDTHTTGSCGTINSGAPSPSARVNHRTGANISHYQHYHSIPGHTHAAVSHLTKYVSLLPAQMTGGNTKAGMILFYRGSSAPTGWSTYAGVETVRMIRGATSSLGGTGGATSHAHATKYHLSSAVISMVAYSGSGKLASKGHQHTSYHNAASSTTVRPVHITLHAMSCDTDGNDIPSGAVAFFKGSVVPDGWTKYAVVADYSRFIKGTTGAYSETPAGSNTHNDTSPGHWSGYHTPGNYATGSNSSFGLGHEQVSHRHYFGAHGHGSPTSIPRHITLLCCIKD